MMEGKFVFIEMPVILLTSGCSMIEANNNL